jgi:hypothetical protein
MAQEAFYFRGISNDGGVMYVTGLSELQIFLTKALAEQTALWLNEVVTSRTHTVEFLGPRESYCISSKNSGE